MSPARCVACSHDQHDEINRRLASTSPPNYSAIGRMFNLDHEAVARHHRHLPQSVVRSGEVAQVATADRIVGLVERSIEDLTWVITRAKEKEDLRAIVGATKGIATQLHVLISAASLILEERRMRDPQPSPEKKMSIGEVEQVLKAEIAKARNGIPEVLPGVQGGTGVRLQEGGGVNGGSGVRPAEFQPPTPETPDPFPNVRSL